VTEHVDAVVVGARCAGSAAAIALARAGRHVVALDRASFPADTVSTHLLFPSGVAELARLGALERVRALGAPPLRTAMIGGAGVEPSATFTPVEGIDHALCVRRTGLDAALVATAREAGAQVREGVRVLDLVRDRGRVAGVRTADGELRAPLVVGADGRRSTVARLVGASRPYREHPNGRACFYAYFTDRQPEWRGVAAQWRAGEELGTAFPCDDGLLLVLLMPPVERAARFRRDLPGEFARTVDRLPRLRDRLEGCTMETKVRAATDTTSYFRRSSGAGWALPGDAGHFKDPVTAQGIRDALRFGRLLGEAAAPVLHDRRRLDAALTAWERGRERECLETYQWTNRLGRAETMTPLEVELYRTLARDPERTQAMLDVFSRRIAPSRALGPARAAGIVARALLRGEASRRATLRAARRDLADTVAEGRERRRASRAPLPPVPEPAAPRAQTAPMRSATAGASR
jgi:flavin-dependent dehydrogenase